MFLRNLFYFPICTSGGPKCKINDFSVLLCRNADLHAVTRQRGRKTSLRAVKPLQCCKWESTHACFNTLLSSCLSLFISLCGSQLHCEAIGQCVAFLLPCHCARVQLSWLIHRSGGRLSFSPTVKLSNDSKTFC